MNVGAILRERVLGRVERPGRYVGGELNAVRPEDKAGARVRIALAFPDLYDLGLGNLGLHILYAILNELPWCFAERVYAPAVDMADLLRAEGIPLFALESRDSLDVFDGIGFTLQSELTWTNILEMLDLAGIPLRSRARGPGDPLIFAGGPASFNPEPLAPFVDFFVLGDGEEAILDVARVFEAVPDRRGRLEALAGVEGVYVPALHPVERLPDGRVLPDPSVKVVRRVLADLERAPFPEKGIVPFIQQVHDRASLEVLRGCTHGCRFCQAGMVTRPVRERSVEAVEALYERTLAATGYEEVGLVSLSTCDHSRVRALVDRIARRAEAERVSVSLPSLRLDSFSVDLADRVAGVRRTGLTFAPEAASPRLRALINKWIPDEDLLGMADRAYGLGWDHVKLYFMIGLPTERDEDVEAIADLTLRTLAVGRARNPRARVNTGVSTFVPKAFTPLQWARQIGPAETRRRQDILAERFRRERGVRFGRHDPAETFIEGLLGRGDRRVADLIEAAWREGARFDAWDEHRDMGAWERALARTGLDPEELLRERALDERLPWDHVDVLVSPDWLKADWRRAMELRHAPDCRQHRCHRCGVIDRKRPLCAHMLRRSVEGRKEEAELGATGRLAVGRPPARPAQRPPAQRLLLRVGIVGDARWLGHLDTLNAWTRALRRAGAPLAWSEGFHPHPRLAFSGARPLGEESLAEWMDVTLVERVDPEAFRDRLAGTVPADFRVFEAREEPLGAGSLMSRIAGADYVFVVSDPPADLDARIAAVTAAERLPVERRRKERKRGRRGRGAAPRTRTVDLRPNLVSLGRASGLPPEATPAPAGAALLDVRLAVVDGRGARPSEIVGLLGLSAEAVRVVRVATWLDARPEAREPRSA